MTNFENKLNTDEALQKAQSHSKFLTILLESKPFLINRLKNKIKKKIQRKHIESFLKKTNVTNLDDLKKSLREMREEFFAISLVRDLNNLADINEVFDTHTNLAQIALLTAYKYHLKKLVKENGNPLNDEGKVQNLIIVGMGKLGGKELNPSSDIDLVFLYQEQGQTSKTKISNQDFFTKLSKSIITTLNDFTEHGIVFRVDTRLRPFGSQGLLVLSLESFENYLITQGLDWERYAWLKARVLIGPKKNINSLIIPFIFRKYLDFNIFASLRNLKSKITHDMSKKINEGDVKYGRGGIRTIEFIVQSYQLVWGGKDKAIRSKNFSKALEELFNKNLIEEVLKKQISDAYYFFRNLEHRLQYMDDAQTHKIPTSDNDRNILAKSMDLKNWSSLKKVIIQNQNRMELIFIDLFSKKDEDIKVKDKYELVWNSELSEEIAVNFLSSIGYKKPDDSYSFLKNIRSVGLYASLPQTSKDRMNQLIPLVIEQVASVDNPDKTLVHMLNAIEAIAKRSSYLSLLKENKNALILLIKIASFDQDVIEKITQQPVMIDDLIDSSYFVKPFDLKEPKKLIIQQLKSSNKDIEEQMNLMRNFKQSMIFKLAVQEQMKIYPTEKVSDALADIADFIVQKAILCIWRFLYPKIKLPKLGVIAYGRFGGKEMSYLSDLDVVFVYEDNKLFDRDKLIKLAQRFNSWMTSNTACGILYDIDFRLRPDGGSGLLVSSWDAFADYQLNKSQTWEHQALTRARFISDNKSLEKKFVNLKTSILQRKRDINELKIYIINMRERIYKNKKPKDDLFDLKQSYGGLVDIEFLTQFNILAYSHKYKDLADNVGNITLLTKIASMGLMDKNEANELIDAYRTYREKQHQQGLNPKNLGKVDKKFVEEHFKNVQKIWNKFSNRVRN